MKFKEYQKLMKIDFEELSSEDKLKRSNEFVRRLDICKMFLTGIHTGRIPDNITDLMEEDDPIKDLVTIMKAQINELPGEA